MIMPVEEENISDDIGCRIRRRDSLSARCGIIECFVPVGGSVIVSAAGLDRHMTQYDHGNRVVDPLHPFLKSGSSSRADCIPSRHIVMPDPVYVIGRTVVFIGPFADQLGFSVHALDDPGPFVIDTEIMRGPDDRNACAVQLRKYFPDKVQDLTGFVFGMRAAPVSDHVADQAHVFHIFRHP